jgi:cytoskeletal protein CcmA (bactofilin family)
VPKITRNKNGLFVERYYYEPQRDIVPENARDLDLRIFVGTGSNVGRIFGGRIEIEQGGATVTQVASAVGMKEIIVGGRAHVNGPLLSGGRISLGPNSSVYGDIAGGEVFVQDNCVINGNILSDEHVTITNGAQVYGIVYSRLGGVAVGEDCVIFDVIAKKSIVLGDRTILLDSVLWSSQGKIEAARAKLGSLINPRTADRNVNSRYTSAEGVESSRISPTRSKHGAELNAGWMTIEDELARRNSLIDLIKDSWAKLYDLNWEIRG